MLRAELAYELVAAKRLAGPDRDPADVLNLVIRDTQCLCDRDIGGVLARARCGLSAVESKKQHCLTQLRLMLLGQLRETAILLHH